MCGGAAAFSAHHTLSTCFLSSKVGGFLFATEWSPSDLDPRWHPRPSPLPTKGPRWHWHPTWPWTSPTHSESHPWYTECQLRLEGRTGETRRQKLMALMAPSNASASARHQLQLALCLSILAVCSSTRVFPSTSSACYRTSWSKH